VRLCAGIHDNTLMHVPGSVCALILASAGATGVVPAAQFEDSARLKKLAGAYEAVDKALRAPVEAGATPGIAWGIVVDGELVHTGVAGVREVSSKAPVEARTAFRIASMTKSFTAAAILQLRDTGKLSLEDRVDRWVPELRGWRPATVDAAPLTVRMLLTHGGGFPEDNPWGDRQLALSDEAFSRMLKLGLLRSTSPGTEFEYSNTGFALLGRIVARASGIPYARYVDQKLLRPLGMTSTRWTVQAVPEAERAHGYRKTDAGFEEELPLGDGAYGAMGGLVTTIPDLARWVALQLQAWPPRDDADPGPVRRSSLREMQTLARGIDPELERDTPSAPLALFSGGYGFGLGSTRTCEIDRVVGHSGGLPGWGSQMRWIPSAGVGVIAFANVTYGGADGAVLRKATRAALDALQRSGGLVPRRPTPARALLEVQAGVNRLLSAWDDAAARALGAENFFLDSSLEERRKGFQDVRIRNGACRSGGPLETVNALRGRWTLRCERGTVRFFATLAPTGTLQELEVTSAVPPDARLSAALGGLLGLASGWDEAKATALFAPKVDRANVRRQLAALSALHGACRAGDPVEGDGRTRVMVTLACEQRPVTATVVLDDASGKVTAVEFGKPEGATCPD
jgi:CubicO group peptidase (beta-lactamase class C family)